MKTKGWGPFRYDWYSICSMHQIHDEKCRACCSGSWRNYWMLCISNVFYKLSPKLWIWWMNRKL